MTKILIGMATAAFWFVLSHAAMPNEYVAKSATTALVCRVVQIARTRTSLSAGASTGAITTAAWMSTHRPATSRSTAKAK
jgi:hypothetical protein